MQADQRASHPALTLGPMAELNSMAELNFGIAHLAGTYGRLVFNMEVGPRVRAFRPFGIGELSGD